MNITEAIDTVRSAIKYNFPLMLEGSPGIGKSDIGEQACQSEGMDLIIRHPIIEDSVDAKGMPGFDAGVAKFFPFEEFNKLLTATKPLVCFIDDFGQASAAVQAAYMQIVLARQIGGKAISKHVRFIAATNSRKDNAGVSNILSAIVSRFTKVKIVADAPSWIKWALGKNMPIELIAFLRFRPALISTFNPAMQKDANPYACPRSIATLGKWIKAGVMDFEVWQGSVGEAFAIEFKGFYDTFQALAGLPDKVLLNPATAPIPQDVATLYALTGALAHRASDVNFANICAYGERLNAENKGEFETAMINDCVTRHANLLESAAYISYGVRNQAIL